MSRLLIFGLGYTASRLATRLTAEGWMVAGTRRSGVLTVGSDAVAAEIAAATHILSSVPPEAGADPVLAAHGAAIAASGAWLGYLSSTGVYGDTRGGWVDETAPVGGGRRDARTQADLAWQALRPAGVHVFRLPGIYGPGRSALDRVIAGDARRIDAPGQVFSRIHVDDIVAAVRAAMRRPRPGVYNIADDSPAPGRDPIEFACDLLGRSYPPLEQLDGAALSPMARAFYSECRRVANGRMKRELGIRLRYPDYRAGLRACLEETP
ncbi:MAG: SDR family NAD(P)-dependent oxidoreductase [Alphaproteobacteria bacterium]|nr:SDR family NAD(P)-dependent oxidoreductase [Alphaproteobacteria bacterium]